VFPELSVEVQLNQISVNASLYRFFVSIGEYKKADRVPRINGKVLLYIPMSIKTMIKYLMFFMPKDLLKKLLR